MIPGHATTRYYASKAMRTCRLAPNEAKRSATHKTITLRIAGVASCFGLFEPAPGSSPRMTAGSFFQTQH
jgi:hypothetical protein